MPGACVGQINVVDKADVKQSHERGVGQAIGENTGPNGAVALKQHPPLTLCDVGDRVGRRLLFLLSLLEEAHGCLFYIKWGTDYVLFVPFPIAFLLVLVPRPFNCNWSFK